MATAFEHDGHCDMAVIVNNDTNAAIMLPLDKIPKLTQQYPDLQVNVHKFSSRHSIRMYNHNIFCNFILNFTLIE